MKIDLDKRKSEKNGSPGVQISCPAKKLSLQKVLPGPRGITPLEDLDPRRPWGGDGHITIWTTHYVRVGGGY